MLNLRHSIRPLAALALLGSAVACKGELGQASGAMPDAQVVSVISPSRPEAGSSAEPDPGTSDAGATSGRPSHSAPGASSSATAAASGSAGGAGSVDASVPTQTPDGGSVTGTCTPVRSHKHLPMRTLVSDPSQHASERILLSADLFTKFYAQCGACHVDQAQGDWRVSRETFAQKFDAAALARVTTDDLTIVMPPFGVKYSAQSEGSPVRDLVSSTEQWLADGSPNDFTIAPVEEPTAADLASPYLLDADAAAQATDLGTCIPSKDMVATETQRSDALDKLFAAATSFGSLPKTLSETDLFTLDSAELARHGVISYAPTYGLFSDDAGKMRYVRVPRGTSVQFDASTQEFDVPENTRIYKTFLKEVTDITGARTWRKLETRLIVVRDDVKLANGQFQPKALFATYAWNDAETEAYLVTDPKRDSTPFADRMVSYFQDEPGTEIFFDDEERANSPTALDDMQQNQLLRHWGIPSSDRCIECHRGSPNHSFLLGFSPLQLRRVPAGEQGEYNTEAGEEVEADELSQLERLIDYGIVTGMESPEEVAPLDQTQSAPPRNEYELKAQAYMVGNCAFCHMPHGLPSIDNPELADLLNFWPNRHLWPEREQGVDEQGNPVKTIGIFQFPLERKSPRIKRGPNQDISIPYITPSLRDYPIGLSELGADISSGDAAIVALIKSSYPKFQYQSGSQRPIAAPWRSLIYRNVDTPFTYADHYAIYPHMPLNVGGFDCKARTIMADWMVSIPARHVAGPAEQNPDRVFYCEKGAASNDCESSWFGSVPGTELGFGAFFTEEQLDRNEQPFFEVKPGGDGYAEAAYNALGRMAEYKGGMRAQCTSAPDMLDPAVLDLAGTYKASNGRSFETPPSFIEDIQIPALGATAVTSDSPRVQSVDGIPDRAHWVNTDLSEPALSEWQPKNLSWAGQFADPGVVSDPALQRTLQLLKELHVTQQLREFALGERPMGTWQVKAECDLTSQPTGNHLLDQGVALPEWLKRPEVDLDAPIYMQAPGEVIFTAICGNCHGPQADSKGRQAGLVSTLTGGNTRVANFKDGFFGPVDAPGSHIASVFAPQAGPSDTADDVAARYMAYMALGGTQRTIPRAVLSVVRNTSVVGVFRLNSPAVASANMLETAVGLCSAVLGANPGAVFSGRGVVHDGRDGLIPQNGDLELWQQLCTLDNPVPLTAVQSGSNGAALAAFYDYKDSTGKVIYPQTAQVLDHNGEAKLGLRSDNLHPSCAHPHPEGGAEVVAGYPLCPSEIVGADGKLTIFKWDAQDIRAWATRGAANAGFAVYVYLDALLRRGYQPKVPFNKCELLPH